MSNTKKNMEIFYQENKHHIDNKVQEYPIHEENFIQWIDNYKNPDLKSLASLFRKYSRYVSYMEFYSKIASICAGIREKSSYFDKIVLMLNREVSKSNFWVGFLVYHFLRDIVTDVVVDSLSNLIFGDEKVLGIICDDASYSGNQIKVMMGQIPSNMTVFFVLPYISTIAMNKIKRLKSKNIIFSSEMEIFKSFEENLKQEKINGLTPKQIKNKYKLDLSKMTIYFAHKLADMVSIYQTIYSMGAGFDLNHIEQGFFEYKPLSLIQNCDLPKEFPDLTKKWNIYDLQDETTIPKMCPLPFYKLYKYKFSNKYISDISNVIYK